MDGIVTKLMYAFEENRRLAQNLIAMLSLEEQFTGVHFKDLNEISNELNLDNAVYLDITTAINQLINANEIFVLKSQNQ